MGEGLDGGEDVDAVRGEDAMLELDVMLELSVADEEINGATAVELGEITASELGVIELEDEVEVVTDVPNEEQTIGKLLVFL